MNRVPDDAQSASTSAPVSLKLLLAVPESFAAWESLAKKLNEAYGVRFSAPSGSGLRIYPLNLQLPESSLPLLLEDAERGTLDALVAKVGARFVQELCQNDQCLYNHVPTDVLKPPPSYEDITTAELKDLLRQHQIQVLLLTTTDTEREALYERMAPLPGRKDLVEGSIRHVTYRLGRLGRYPVAHVESTMGSQARHGAALTIHDAIHELAPRVVLAVGIAFGLNPVKQQLGDVIVAESVIPYELQRVGMKVIHRGQAIACGGLLSERFRTRRAGWKLKRGEDFVQIFQGDILSGEKLVDNMEFRARLLEAFPQALAGEMEGTGLYAATAREGVEVLLIKGLCDWGDGSKTNRAQAFAARAAVSLVEHVLSKKEVLAPLVGNEVEPAPREKSQPLKPASPSPQPMRLRLWDWQTQSPPARQVTEWPRTAKSSVDALRSGVASHPLFSWIHLSDIHIGHGDATHVEDQKLVLGALRRDVEHRLAFGAPQPDAIFVTGDIAFSGGCRTPDEYTRAVQWLADIAKTAGLGFDSVFVVPGNHDVQRTADKPMTARTLLSQLRKGEASLDEALTDSAARAQLTARQTNYLAFAKGLAPACRADAEAAGAQLYWRHILTVRGGLRVRLVGLNTALLAADEAVFESDQGRLWLGTRQFAAAFTEPEVAPDELVVVLSHHPLRDHWLADETAAARWIRSHAHLHLSGHVHEGDSEHARSGGGTHFVSISAGAVHGEKTPHGYPARHGYSFGALVASNGMLKVGIWPRMWSDANKDFRLDVDNVPPNETHAQQDLPHVRLSEAVKAEAVTEAPGIEPEHHPVPHYPDDETRQLSLRLENARERKRGLQEAGASTAQVDQEILGLRRQLREGGQLRAGDSLGEGRFLLIESIGQGGFAHIWMAADRVRRETVAIKVLHTNLAGDVVKRERFFRGARMMAELQHPAVVKVVEQHGVDGGYHYFVMEYVAGGNLRQAVLEKTLTQDQILSVILRIGEALALAHSRGVIHRDVKPANILLDGQGQPLLTDFDLVGAADTTGGTRTGAMGTFVYAAPECLERPQEADQRADVYSLGMTAVFGLHGTDLPIQILRTPEFFVSRLPCAQSLKEALSPAISLEPDDRYQQMSEFISAVQQARSGSSAPREAPQSDASPVEPRKVRLTVHRAFFLRGGQECFFINATNLSRTREVELTHIWLELHSQIPVLHADRPLPKRLKPDESWETWIQVDTVPEQFHEIIYTLARARLSSGQIVSSEKNEGVPEEGAVPGGPITKV